MKVVALLLCRDWMKARSIDFEIQTQNRVFGCLPGGGFHSMGPGAP
jgi:hypothetical protein